MRIRDEVARAIQYLDLEAVELSTAEASAVIAQVAKRHADDAGAPLWERLKTPGRRDPDGWKTAASFFEGEVTLFSDADESKPFAYRLESSDVTTLLEECFGFVFYLTDEAYSTLVCFNDHDALIASRVLGG